MADLEKVITHLDDLRLFADVTVHPVVSPDNWDVYSSLCDYIDQIKTEVEYLLKEQEAVEPDVDSEGTCSCGNCGENVGYYPVGSKVPEKLCKYCPECGKAVKWE